MRSFPKTRRSTNNPWLLVIVLILACHPSEYRNGSSQSVSELLLTVGSLRLLAVTEAFTSDPFRLHSSAVSALTRREKNRRTLDVPPFLLSSSSSAQQQPQEDEEWHPHDPAWTTSQLLKGLWSQIAQAKDMVKGVRVCVFVCVCAWFCYNIVQFLNNNNCYFYFYYRKHIQSCIRKWRNSSIRHAF